MTALADNKMRDFERWTRREYTLTSGTVAYQGARALLVLATGYVRPGASVAGCVDIGHFERKYDATSAAVTCTVVFDRELQIEWLANGAAGDALASTDVGQLCYVVDDQTVGKVSTGGRAVAGRVRAFSSTRGVAVERLQEAPRDEAIAAAPAFVANDSVVTTALLDSVKILTVPATGAASTVTLPAGARPGQTVRFVADGTLNGHTVQYVDATGPTNLTTALTASKRHAVVATFDGTIWYAAAYVSP